MDGREEWCQVEPKWLRFCEAGHSNIQPWVFTEKTRMLVPADESRKIANLNFLFVAYIWGNIWFRKYLFYMVEAREKGAFF